MFLILLGEVVFGGVGSGFYTMIGFLVLSVFIAGLMIGRVPEYLGKKIEALEMKMAVITVLVPGILVLLFSGIALVSTESWRFNGKSGSSWTFRSGICLCIHV